MLTDNQIQEFRAVIHECDSVYDAIGTIENKLGRELSIEECAQIVPQYTKNGAVEAQNEQKRRNSTEEYNFVNKTERIAQLANQLVDTYRRKNIDYGDSFGISVRKYGIIAALTRMSDKWNRLENLILHMDENSVPNVADESVLDTLLDLATYAFMTYMEIENK